MGRLVVKNLAFRLLLVSIVVAVVWFIERRLRRQEASRPSDSDDDEA